MKVHRFVPSHRTGCVKMMVNSSMNSRGNGRPSLNRFVLDKSHLRMRYDVWFSMLGRMILHLSPTSLPNLSSTLISHSGCLGPHEFTLVSHLSPTLGVLGRMILQFCLPLVSHTCLPLWMSWGAWVYTCLPLVFHTCLPHLFPTLVSHSGFLGLHGQPALS